MNAKKISLAIALAACASNSVALAQCVQVTGPAKVTSQTVQMTGCPTVSSSQVLAAPASTCAASSTLTQTNSFAAVVDPSPKVIVSPHPVLDFGLFGKRLLGYGRVIRDWDLR